jgi:hypothetical protein
MVFVVTAVAQEVSYPLPWNTSYSIANISDQPASVVVDYHDADGVADPTMQRSFPNIPGGGSVTILQATESTLGPGVWSAVVSADQPIAAVVNQQTDAGNGDSQPPFSSYSAASEGAYSVILPSVMHNWFGYHTEIVVQNVGGGEANDVDVEFIPTTFRGCTAGAVGIEITNQQIPQYASKTWSQVSQTALGAPSVPNCSLVEGRFLGAARITSDQPVAVVVNQHTQGKLLTYNGFFGGAYNVTLPAYMRNYFGYYASLTIANPGDEDAEVNITYQSDAQFSIPANKVVTATITVPAGESVVRYDGPGSVAPDTDLAADFPEPGSRFFGSVTLNSDYPIVAMVNQESTPTSGAQAGAYNGFATNEGTGKISVPLIQSAFYGYYTSLTILTVDGGEATVRITYTSDGTYSSVQNQSVSYEHTTVGGFLNRYEGPLASAAQSDILDDPDWVAGGQRRFIGSAIIEVLSGSDIVAYVNSEKSVASIDSMYTFNAFNID